MALAPRRMRPPRAIPPPTPVPRITPKTACKPAAAPSVASDSKAVGVIGQADRPPERRLEILPQRATDQAGRVGVLDQSGDRRNRPGYPDPNRGDFADLLFGSLNESGDRFYRLAIIPRGRRDAAAGVNCAKAVDGCCFNLCA